MLGVSCDEVESKEGSPSPVGFGFRNADTQTWTKNQSLVQANLKIDLGRGSLESTLSRSPVVGVSFGDT